MPNINFIPATEKQINYINILVVDLSFTLKERNFYMSRTCARKIDTPDELSKTEASAVISLLKKYKENKIQPESFFTDDEASF